jgi:hypothetical protein
MALVHPILRREHPEFHTYDVPMKARVSVKPAVTPWIPSGLWDAQTHGLQITPALQAQLASNPEVALAVVNFLSTQLEDKNRCFYHAAIEIIKHIMSVLSAQQAIELLERSLHKTGLSVVRCTIFEVLLERLQALSALTVKEKLAPWLQDEDRYIRHRASVYLHQALSAI